jgi:hypothetical protein
LSLMKRQPRTGLLQPAVLNRDLRLTSRAPSAN